jgi:hypothetical protein
MSDALLVTAKNNSEASSDGIYYTHRKHIVLLANIDGVPISTNLHMNVESKNKNANIELRELWIDGERLIFVSGKQ